MKRFLAFLVLLMCLSTAFGQSQRVIVVMSEKYDNTQLSHQEHDQG